MNVLILGANGFIGRNLCEELEHHGHQVAKGIRQPAEQADEYQVDMLDIESIGRAIHEAKPEAIVQAAGIVSSIDTATQNQVFTNNMLEAATNADLPLKRIIVLGSAAEYGIVEPSELPVKETTPLHGTSTYAISKIEEVHTALDYRQRGLPVTVARIFNPIGPGMNEKFLTSRLLAQIVEYQAHQRTNLEVSRLDAQRDYIHIHDIVGAIRLLIEGQPKEAIYNLGSGRPASNGEIVNLLLENSRIEPRPPVVETLDQAEPLYAVQADVTRMTSEFDWSPHITIEQAIKEIVDDGKR